MRFTLLHQPMTSKQHSLTLQLLPQSFAVARLEPDADVPAWAGDAEFVSVTRTLAELSIVCEESLVPGGIKAQRGFKCLRVVGPLAFTETGILESLATPLSLAGVSIFALSTFDTDYLLLPESVLEKALSALTEAGHKVE